MLERDQADPGQAEGVGGGGLPLDAAVALGSDFEEQVGLGFRTQDPLGGGLDSDHDVDGPADWHRSRRLHVDRQSLVDGRVRPGTGHRQRRQSGAGFADGGLDPPHRVQRDLVVLVPVPDPGSIQRGVLTDPGNPHLGHIARNHRRTKHTIVGGRQELGVAVVHRDQQVELTVGRVAADLLDGAAHRRTSGHHDKAGWEPPTIGSSRHATAPVSQVGALAGGAIAVSRPPPRRSP
jgi:hypothetical protein